MFNTNTKQPEKHNSLFWKVGREIMPFKLKMRTSKMNQFHNFIMKLFCIYYCCSQIFICLNIFEWQLPIFTTFFPYVLHKYHALKCSLKTIFKKTKTFFMFNVNTEHLHGCTVSPTYNSSWWTSTLLEDKLYWREELVKNVILLKF